MDEKSKNPNKDLTTREEKVIEEMQEKMMKHLNDTIRKVSIALYISIIFNAVLTFLFTWGLLMIVKKLF